MVGLTMVLVGQTTQCSKVGRLINNSNILLTVQDLNIFIS